MPKCYINTICHHYDRQCLDKGEQTKERYLFNYDLYDFHSQAYYSNIYISILCTTLIFILEPSWYELLLVTRFLLFATHMYGSIILLGQNPWKDAAKHLFIRQTRSKCSYRPPGTWSSCKARGWYTMDFLLARSQNHRLQEASHY